MINTIYIDFHGVLTDGKMNMNHDGTVAFESMHHRDTVAIREFIAKGYRIYIVTASEGPIIKSYVKKVGCSLLIMRDKSQVITIADEPYIAIGDSSFDIPMFNKAARKFCPADASAPVLEHEGIEVLDTKGGKGCIEELLGILEYCYVPKGKKKWEPQDTSTPMRDR